MKRSLFLLRNLYIFLFIVVIALIIFTPWLIRHGFSIINEETLEAIIISLLFAVSYVIYILYRNEIAKNQAELQNLKERRLTLEERLDDAFRHIGQVNVQIQEIKSIFSAFKKYPESKSDFKNILRYFSEKILAMAAVDWVLLKIIDLANGKTLSEHSRCREGAVSAKSKFGNIDLINQADSPAYEILSSHQENLDIKAYCLLPKKKISQEAEIFIRAIVNQLEMIFLIYSSNYYKNGKVKNNSKDA